MLYVGLDLSRKRLDFDARLSSGELFERGAVPPDADGLDGLVRRLGDAEVLAVIESMSTRTMMIPEARTVRGAQRP